MSAVYHDKKREDDLADLSEGGLNELINVDGHDYFDGRQAGIRNCFLNEVAMKMLEAVP